MRCTARRETIASSSGVPAHTKGAGERFVTVVTADDVAWAELDEAPDEADAALVAVELTDSVSSSFSSKVEVRSNGDAR
jgi:hypothetical protein